VLIDSALLLGGNRAGNDLSIAVDPTNSDIVYIAWSDNTGPDYTLRVRRSLDRGEHGSADLITVDNASLQSLAINSLGTAGMLYLQSVPNQAERESHFRSTDNGTTWDDTLLTRTITGFGGPPGAEGFIGDFTRMVAVGPNFYGVFPAPNSPDPVHFFPNGGGTFRFQRNTRGPALIGTDGNTIVIESVDPFFFKAEEVSTGVVQGHVRDATGNSIADASVLVGSTQLSTDSEGFYTLTVDAGVYDVLAVQSGFVPMHARVTVCALGTTTKDFTLGQGVVNMTSDSFVKGPSQAVSSHLPPTVCYFGQVTSCPSHRSRRVELAHRALVLSCGRQAFFSPKNRTAGCGS
jgi:hypothetical protein